MNEEEVRAWAGESAPPAEGPPGEAAAAGEEPAEPERAEDVLMFVANEMEEIVGKLSGIRAAGDYATKASGIAEKMQPFVEELRDLAADYVDEHAEMTQEERAAAEEAATDMGDEERAAEEEATAEEEAEG